MEPTNNTKRIEQYLANELSAEQKNAFKNTLSQDAALQKELAQQIAIHEAAQRANARVQIKKVAKSYHFYKNIVTLSLIVAIMGVAGIVGYFLLKDNLESSPKQNLENSNKENQIHPTLLTQLASNAPINNLQSDFFTWNGSDSVIISKNGVLLSIPKDALLLDGKPYNEPAIIQWQEALDAPTIMKSGLSTTSNGKLLETQGMFGLEAYTKDGKKLSVNPNVGIYVQVPVDQYKKGMQLFKGEKDKTGMINWVNPTPLQKIPVPVDMKDLNFYPKGYEETLNKLKLPQGRKYRDSLYASLEEGNFEEIDKINKIEIAQIKVNGVEIKINPSAKLNLDILDFKVDVIKTEENTLEKESTSIFRLNSEIIFYKDLFSLNKNQNQDPCTITFNDSSEKTKYLYKPNILNVSTLRGTKTTDGTSTIEHDFSIKSRLKKIPIQFNFYFEVLTYKNEILKYEIVCKTTIFQNIYKSKSIPPSKVLAFWNKKFNNTNLATREFEARMKEIHPTCKAEVLALYVNNLNKNISDIDHQVVNMGYTTFEEFAKEQVGALNPNNPHLNSLIKFYDQTAKEISEKTSQLIAKQLKREKVFDSELAQSRMKETDRAILRKVQASNEEYELNLNNVYKQLGKEKSSIRQITNKTIGVTIINSGVYNIDKYVMDATVSRTSTVITDPETGKTAKITYNDFSFQVKDANKYPKLFAYLFPSKLNSYQHISGTNGSFTYPLNDDIVYHLAIVGINEDGFFYYEQKNIKEGKLGEIVLEKLTEKEMDQRIDALNESRGIIKPMKIKDELGWLVKEQKYYVETKRRMEQARFVRRMKRVVFPCYKEKEEGSAEEEISDNPMKN